MNDYTYSKSFYINPHEADATKHLTPTILGNYILNTAGMAAREFGFGMDTMHNQGVAWVVSRMSIEINELPKEYTTIKIKTWIEDVNPICSARNYLVYDESDKIIAQATTLWSVIDTSTRKMVNLVTHSTISKFIHTTEETEFTITRTKRIDVTGEPDNKYPYTVKYSDIDMNNHVNSMKYIQWVIDTLPIEKIKKGIKKIDINYIKEALYGDELFIKHYNKEGKEIFEIQKEDNTCCKITLEI